MPDIATRLDRIRATLPEGVTLVAVSKFHPVEAVAEAYAAGQRIFGESRVQELAVKVPALPADIQWHFIGHLQTNKVNRLVALRPALIESVDSLRVLEAIDRAAHEQGTVQRVLMQVHVAQEETKTGFLPEELKDYFARREFEKLRATHLCGIMGMASNTTDVARIEADFRAIATLATDINRDTVGLEGFDIVSMGMSHDYLIAIDAGSTMVRIGTDIFGERQY